MAISTTKLVYNQFTGMWETVKVAKTNTRPLLYPGMKVMEIIMPANVKFLDTRKNQMNMGITHIYQVTVTRYLNETEDHRHNMEPKDHVCWLRERIEDDAKEIEQAVGEIGWGNKEIEIEASL